MAEYCSKCARKYGMLADIPPLLCEGCGKDIDKVSFWNVLKKKVKKIITYK